MMFALAAVLRSAVRQDAQQRKVLLFIMPGARPRSMLTIDFMAIQTRRALLDLPSLWDQMTETRIILESTIRSVNAQTNASMFVRRRHAGVRPAQKPLSGDAVSRTGSPAQSRM